jgi:glycosyltransferase involved in cell wall biosynthesis
MLTSKTIWYISKYFAPKSASPGCRGGYIMDELAKLGHKTLVIASDSNNLIVVPSLNKRITVTSDGNTDIVWLKTLKYKTAKSWKRILSWIHFEWNLFILKKSNLPKPDVIIISSLSLLTILNGLFLKQKYKCKLVFEIRDIWPLTIIEEGGFSHLNPLVFFLSIIEKIGYKYADIIIGTMPNLSAHVEQVLGYKKIVHCIPMGIPPETLTPQKKILSGYTKSLDLRDKFIVLYAGTVGITNALDTLFKAAIMMQDCFHIHFVILGDGALLQYYKNTFCHLKNLSFIPKVPKEKVHPILKQADILYFSTFPSNVWKYGQSLNKIIDYMMSEKPIIASYSGFQSMINEANCGCFVPAGDVNSLSEKILEYSQLSLEARELIGKRGKKWLIANRTYPKLAVDYANILFQCE